MSRKHLTVMFLVSIVGACASPPEPVAPPPPAATPPSPAPPSPAPAAAVEPPKPAEPTAEEKKKAQALAELNEDRAKIEADQKAEVARLTPEIHAEAKAIAEKTYPTGKAAIQAAAKGKFRKPGNADRDKFRHPAETLDFLGFKPNMTVVEFGPGEGWYTELLAPALASKGKLYVTSGDPNGPSDSPRTLYAQRTKMFLERLPEAYGKVETIVVDNAAPNLGHDGQVDMVFVARELHGLVNNKHLEDWLAAFNKALKPNGILAIEEHRAKADAVAEESSKKGYVPEKWAIEKIEAAGFKLAGKSEINANKKDTKDYPEGVWTLPPTLRLGDKDKDKYVAIGESDRMTLKFVKVPPKNPPKK